MLLTDLMHKSLVIQHGFC